MKESPSAKRIYSRLRRRTRPNRRVDRSRATTSSSQTKWRRHGTALPSWKDLSNQRRLRDEREGSFLERISTVRFALVVLALAGAFTLYVGHVHATQDLLARLQEVRQTSRSLHLKHNRLKGAFDRATGPAVIYERAQALGLEGNLAYGPAIEVEDE